jgi:hypothetical protein
MNEILNSFDKNKVKCSGCGKYIDKEEAWTWVPAERIGEKPEKTVGQRLYWCVQSFRECTNLYYDNKGITFTQSAMMTKVLHVPKVL